MKIIRICIAALARLIISAIFLAGAVNNILNWQEAEKELITTLSEWQSYTSFSATLHNLFSMLTLWSPLLLIIATLFMLVGGLLVLLGIKEKLGAFLLFIFLIPATVLYHQFWFIEGAARDLQMIMFLKNLAIIGCLLLMMLHGGQAKSGESRFSSLKI